MQANSSRRSFLRCLSAYRHLILSTCGILLLSSAAVSALEAVHFSVERGVFDHPFQLQLSTAASNAVIRFTTDGQPPTQTQGQVYTGPLRVEHTTTLRAAAFRIGTAASAVATHSYIFPQDVLRQSEAPPGFPTSTNWSDLGLPSDYAMDARIVDDPQYSSIVTPALLSLPSLSIVMKTEDMFGEANGLYTHPADASLEAPCSVELINPDGTAGFQVDAGIQIHGDGARLRTLKHPFRLRFKSEYGPSKLHFRFFPDSAVTAFDTIDLRADYNNHWTHGFSASQRARGGLIRDAWYKDVLAAMGALSSHSRYVHLYINGLYWGIYNPCERPDAAFAASYLGGTKEEYDVFNGTPPNPPIEGDGAAREMLLGLTGLDDPNHYLLVQSFLKVGQFVDGAIMQWYGANQDLGVNWYSFRRRQPGEGFYYVSWDSERTLEEVEDDSVCTSPDDLNAKLAESDEYRMLVADRLHKHLFNDGALTTNALIQSWMKRAAQLDTAIVAESARWGHAAPKEPLDPLPYPTYHAGTPYNRNEDWLGEQGRLLTNYLPRRTGIFLDQMRAAGFYPTLAAPEFNQHGGWVPAGFPLEIRNPGGSGTIFYSTNGVDPRVPLEASVAADALTYVAGEPVRLGSSVLVKSRIQNAAGDWSALTEAQFQVAERGVPVRITEIMHRPRGGDAYEFIELQNVGRTPIDLSGASFEGVEFVFPYGTTLSAGGLAVLIRETDPVAFQERYPSVQVLGAYSKHLAEDGERLALLDRSGQTITSVTYGSADPWPVLAKGAGRSLELIDPAADQADPANWQISAALGGSPGEVNSVPPSPPVRINELLVTGLPSSAPFCSSGSWLELYNADNQPRSLAGWTLSRDGGQGKFVFPEQATLPAHRYLVVWCDGQTSSPGFHTGFSLSPEGDQLALYDQSNQRVDAVSYGPQLPGYSIARGTPEVRTWQLNQPSPGAVNQTAAAPGSSALVLNEWMANPASGSGGWIELFNTSDAAPAALTGVYLEINHALFQIKTPGFVPPRGHARLWADQKPGGNHLDLVLPPAGQIRLFDANGRLLDDVVSQARTRGSSEGRFPDGSATIVSLETATPGLSNIKPGVPLLSVRPRSPDSAVFQFQISGEAGAEYTILSSRDLVHWTVSGKSAAFGVPAGYTDALDTSSAARFYRALRQSPP